MGDPATYRRYAEECRRLAKTMPAENRHVLLEIARADEVEMRPGRGRPPERPGPASLSLAEPLAARTPHPGRATVRAAGSPARPRHSSCSGGFAGAEGGG